MMNGRGNGPGRGGFGGRGPPPPLRRGGGMGGGRGDGSLPPPMFSPGSGRGPGPGGGGGGFDRGGSRGSENPGHYGPSSGAMAPPPFDRDVRGPMPPFGEHGRGGRGGRGFGPGRGDGGRGMVGGRNEGLMGSRGVEGPPPLGPPGPPSRPGGPSFFGGSGGRGGGGRGDPGVDRFYDGGLAGRGPGPGRGGGSMIGRGHHFEGRGSGPQPRNQQHDRFGDFPDSRRNFPPDEYNENRGAGDFHNNMIPDRPPGDFGAPPAFNNAPDNRGHPRGDFPHDSYPGERRPPNDFHSNMDGGGGMNRGENMMDGRGDGASFGPQGRGGAGPPFFDDAPPAYRGQHEPLFLRDRPHPPSGDFDGRGLGPPPRGGQHHDRFFGERPPYGPNDEIPDFKRARSDNGPPPPGRFRDEWDAPTPHHNQPYAQMGMRDGPRPYDKSYEGLGGEREFDFHRNLDRGDRMAGGSMGSGRGNDFNYDAGGGAPPQSDQFGRVRPGMPPSEQAGSSIGMAGEIGGRLMQAGMGPRDFGGQPPQTFRDQPPQVGGVGGRTLHDHHLRRQQPSSAAPYRGEDHYRRDGGSASGGGRTGGINQGIHQAHAAPHMGVGDSPKRSGTAVVGPACAQTSAVVTDSSERLSPRVSKVAVEPRTSSPNVNAADNASQGRNKAEAKTEAAQPKTPPPVNVKKNMAVVPPSPPSPPSPRPAPPSALAKAMTRLADLTADMEFAYAKQVMLSKEHEKIKARLEVLEKLPVGMDAFADELAKMHADEAVKTSGGAVGDD